MDAYKINTFLEEVIGKTKQRSLVWEKTAQAGQFVTSIGGKFVLSIAGPTPPHPSIINFENEYRTILKELVGKIVFDIALPSTAYALTPPPSLAVNGDLLKALYLIVVNMQQAEENKSLDQALDALKKL
jgi:hypothetical protein